MRQMPLNTIALGNAHIAREAVSGIVRYCEALPPDAWSGPTACADWTIRDAVVHVAAVSLLFSRLARTRTGNVPVDSGDSSLLNRTDITAGDKVRMFAASVRLDALPTDDLLQSMIDSTDNFVESVERANVEQLQAPVCVPFGEFPLFVITNMLAIEGALHHWDIRFRRDLDSVVPPEWAVPLAGSLAGWVPYLARPGVTAERRMVWRLHVGDGIADVSIVIHGPTVMVDLNHKEPADIELSVSADQYLRLLFGRLPLAEADARRETDIQSRTDDTVALNQIFAGI